VIWRDLDPAKAMAAAAATAAWAATAVALAVVAACWLADWAAARRRLRRVGGEFFSPPDPPKQGKKRSPGEKAYEKKGGHGAGGSRAGGKQGGKRLPQPPGVRGRKKKGYAHHQPASRPVLLRATVLLLPLHSPGQRMPDSPVWGAAQDAWNAAHILGPPTADGPFLVPPTADGSFAVAQQPYRGAGRPQPGHPPPAPVQRAGGGGGGRGNEPLVFLRVVFVFLGYYC
jgi:hypothetical protein